MLNIQKLENSWYFETLELNAWELLFDEWEIDNNLYIIKFWELLIEKYTNNERNKTKKLATLKNNAIFWEWSINNSDPKQVKIVAKSDTILLKIDATNKLEEYIWEFTKDWIELLSQIIEITNKRLLEANYLVTSNYSISKEISELNEFNNKNLFKIIKDFEKTIDANYIIFLEKNPILENYLSLKFDSRIENKMQNLTIELDNNTLNADKLSKNW